MNQEIIERLVIDKASGELTPDAAALLDDWLCREPGAKAEAAEIEETLALAKCALVRGEEKAILRPKFRRPAWLPWAAGMAACFVAGLALGLLPVRQPMPKPSTGNYEAAPDAGFWSARRWQMTSPSAKIQGPRLIWKSPIRKPQLEASS